MDFIYGAAAAEDGLGKSIIALPSRTSKGQPKIVPHVKEGAGVVTTKGHVRLYRIFFILQIPGPLCGHRIWDCPSVGKIHPPTCL